MEKRENQLGLQPILYDSHKKDEPFRRLKLHGRFLHENEIYIGPRGPPPGAISSSGPNSGRGGGLSSSPQGYFVVTPFELSSEYGKGTVLINRGWVPRHLIISTSQQNKSHDSFERPLGTLDIVGVASKVEGTFFQSS